MKKLVLMLLGLLFSIPAYCAILTTQFDPVNHTWQPNSSVISDMVYLDSIITIGNNSIAFGCKAGPGCDTQFNQSPVFSIYDAAHQTWSSVQSIPNVDSILETQIFLDTSITPPPAPTAWVIGQQNSPPYQYMVSYFGGKQFSPGVPVPNTYTDFVLQIGLPFAVYHHKFWYFTPIYDHKVYWITNTDTEWHELPTLPGAPSTDIVVVSRDNTSQEIYLLGSSEGAIPTIYHLLPNETWSTPITISNPNVIAYDMRVMNNGQIICVLVSMLKNPPETHILITQDGGKTWRDTGILDNQYDVRNGFNSIYSGNKLNIFWRFDNNALRYLNPYETNPAWKTALYPENLKPAKALNYTLVSSIEGNQAWLYGYDINNNFVAFYYDLKLKKYVNPSLQGVADVIYSLEPSSDGKAFAYGERNSQAVALYFDGVKWNSTPLTYFNGNSAIRMSYLPFNSAMNTINISNSIIPFRQMVDPAYNNAWLFNQRSFH